VVSGANESGNRFIFVLRALLGEVYVCKQSSLYVRPPCTAPNCTRPNCDHRLFDSVMAVSRDGTSRLAHREFIVYDRQRCYPEFLVEYGISQGPRPLEHHGMSPNNQVPGGSSSERSAGLQHHDERKVQVSGGSSSERSADLQHHDEQKVQIQGGSSREQHVQYHDERRSKVSEGSSRF